MSTITSVANLRDLGGLRTADGRAIAARRLYRSSHLANLSDGDAHLLGLRTVVDLRGVDERAAAPARGLGTGTRQVHLPIEPRAAARLQSLRAGGEQADEAAVVRLMQQVYRRYVQEQSAIYAGLVRELLRADAFPLLFHCTAGKDRTGFGAAVVLLALGVSHEGIQNDFLLSNLHWKSTHTDSGWVTLARVRAEYLHTAFEAMREDWGSIDAYLERALGIDDTVRAELRTRLLE